MEMVATIKSKCHVKQQWRKNRSVMLLLKRVLIQLPVLPTFIFIIIVVVMNKGGSMMMTLTTATTMKKRQQRRQYSTTHNNHTHTMTHHRTSTKQHTTTRIKSVKKFPLMDEVLEMATLSSLIYAFHTEDYGNDDVNTTVCDRINQLSTSTTFHNKKSNNDNVRRNGNAQKHYKEEVEASINNRTIPNGITCEWYHHDWTDGTQVMIVTKSSSESQQSTTTNATSNNNNNRHGRNDNGHNNHKRSNTSSNYYDYIAIVFAGTDDMTTSLTDVDVLLTPFGYPKDTSTINTTVYPLYNVSLLPPNSNNSDANNNIRVHSGFDTTLFNRRNLFGEIVYRVEQIRSRRRHGGGGGSNSNLTPSPPPPKLYTTGHSLGGSYSILMAIGLTRYYENVRITKHTSSSTRSSSRQPSLPVVVDEITTINFGCPQIGNVAFRDYIHNINNAYFPIQRLHIYRYVLGWDIVPRLPTLLQHVGHTIQLSTISDTYVPSFFTNTTGNVTRNITTAAYYHHLGNVTLQYAPVPFGWSATPFIWIPGAVTAHYITAYIQCLLDLRQQQQQNRTYNNNDWIADFERLVPISNDTVYDDDYYVEPPNDDGHSTTDIVDVELDESDDDVTGTSR